MGIMRDYRVYLEHETRHTEADNLRKYPQLERIEVFVEANDAEQAVKLAREPLMGGDSWKVRCVALPE